MTENDETFEKLFADDLITKFLYSVQSAPQNWAAQIEFKFVDNFCHPIETQLENYKVELFKLTFDNKSTSPCARSTRETYRKELLKSIIKFCATQLETPNVTCMMDTLNP